MVNCIICGKAFEPKQHRSNPYRAKTCSLECRIMAAVQTRGVHPPLDKVCKGCGKPFTVPWKLRDAMYCSNACRITAMPKGRPLIGEYKPCLECGREFWVIPGKVRQDRGTFCSRSCAARYRVRTHAIQYPTSIESLLYAALDQMGIAYEPQFGMGRYVVDAWLPVTQTIIEADGAYWHSRPDRQERDRKLTAFAERRGYVLVRLDEHFIKSLPLDELAAHIRQFIPLPTEEVNRAAPSGASGTSGGAHERLVVEEVS